MATQVRGNISSMRKQYLEPQIGFELSKLARAIPRISQGTQFPNGGAQFGDMHFFTGESNESFKKNNWYVMNPLGDWGSMNPTDISAANLVGEIPSGVKIKDYLSLFGGTMEGEIVFTEKQMFPAEQIADGVVPPGVIVLGAFPITGGTLQGDLDMADHLISSISFLEGFDSDIYIDMSVDGHMALGADVEILLTAPSIVFAGNLTGATGNISMWTNDVPYQLQLIYEPEFKAYLVT